MWWLPRTGTNANGDCDHGSLICRWVWGALRLPIAAILYGKAGRFQIKPRSPAF